MSQCSFKNTHPGADEVTLKWWYFLTAAILFKCGAKKSVQSNVWTIMFPSSRATNCAKLHSAESLTTCAMDWRLSTFVLRNCRLNSPKHQSGANFVCPTRVMDVCLPVSTRQIRYCIMQLFLFWPQQLCACKCTSFSPQIKEVVKSANYCIGSFPTISSFICKEVDLSGEGLTINTKYGALPRCQEVYGTRLQWIGGVVYLLSIVERVVGLDILGITCCLTAWLGGANLPSVT